MARLGELLLAEKVLTADDLDSALENHVLHGVILGTCLVEMGYVSDDDLARCLGKKTGQTFLTKDQLLEFGTQHLSIISPTAMKKNRAIPVGIHEGALRIACDQDLSPEKQAELEISLGWEIEPVAVSGYAIDSFFEHVFGTPRPGRFLPKFSRGKTSEEEANVLKNEAPIIIDGVEWKSLGDVEQGEEFDWISHDIFNATPNFDNVPLSLSDAAEHLSHAMSRDDVAKTVLDFLSNSSRTAALYIIKDGVVRGWKAYSNQRKLPEVEAFNSPLETLPDIQQCVISKKPYLGKETTEETNLLLQNLHYTGGRPAYFPIFLQQRVIAVLLCDRFEKLNPTETAELCRKASFALEILVLRSKILSA